METRLLSERDLPEVRRLMSDFGLAVPEGVAFGVGLFDGARLMACCQFKDGLIQGLAVDRAAQGEGLMGHVVGEVIRRAAALGYRNLGVITKPDAAAQFLQMGFRRVAGAEPSAVYLEFGRGGAADERARLALAAEGKHSPRAALVLNANPFTLGHRHLVRRAAMETAQVFVLVVQEDASAFPFADRLALVEAGCRDMEHVTVLPGGPYAVSRRTFPAYFTRQADLATAQGAMDAALFSELIAPALGASRRYVGTEPLSPTTAAYNGALKARLPASGIELIELPRFELDGIVVSATTVRGLLAQGDIEAAKQLVPETTAAYFDTEAGRAVIEGLGGDGA